MVEDIMKFCLFTLNGPFYEMPQKMVASKRLWVDFVPILSLYIALFGSVSYNISFIIANILLLYNISNQFDTAISASVRKLYWENPRMIWTMDLLFYPLIFLILIVSVLDLVYMLPYRKTLLILDFVANGIIKYLLSHVIENSVLIKAISFLLGRCYSYFYSIFYLKYGNTINTILFSFLGSYYFVDFLRMKYLYHAIEKNEPNTFFFGSANEILNSFQNRNKVSCISTLSFFSLFILSCWTQTKLSKKPVYKKTKS